MGAVLFKQLTKEERKERSENLAVLMLIYGIIRKLETRSKDRNLQIGRLIKWCPLSSYTVYHRSMNHKTGFAKFQFPLDLWLNFFLE